MEPLQIIYKFSLIDARDFNLYLSLKSPRTWIFLLVTPLIVFFMLYKESVLWLTLIICAMSYVGAIVLQIGYIFWCVESVWSKTEHGEIKLVSDSGNLYFFQTGAQSQISWSAVKSIDKTSKFIVIKLRDGNATVIPKRAFLNGAVMNDFYMFALSNIKSNG